MKKIIALSGGLDSTTLLAHVSYNEHTNPENVLTVSFDYGSKHNPYEIAKAKQIAVYYKVDHKVIDLKQVMEGFKSNLMENGGDIPEGHYEDVSMSLTVVPSRNIIFTSILSGLVWSLTEKDEPGIVYLGIHSGDHAIYPDCRPDFYFAMKEALATGTDKKVVLEAPFLDKNKADIVKIGLQLKVPYSSTRTCYKQQLLACGKCGSCQERIEAFLKNNAQDPIRYEM